MSTHAESEVPRLLIPRTNNLLDLRCPTPDGPATLHERIERPPLRRHLIEANHAHRLVGKETNELSEHEGLFGVGDDSPLLLENGFRQYKCP